MDAKNSPDAGRLKTTPYEKPELVLYGDIRSITRTSEGENPDSAKGLDKTN